MPSSMGWVLLVVFGDRKKRLIAFNPVSLGWAEQLSTTMATFLFWFLKHRSSLLSQAVKSSEVIQAFLCAS